MKICGRLMYQDVMFYVCIFKAVFCVSLKSYQTYTSRMSCNTTTSLAGSRLTNWEKPQTEISKKLPYSRTRYTLCLSTLIHCAYYNSDKSLSPFSVVQMEYDPTHSECLLQPHQEWDGISCWYPSGSLLQSCLAKVKSSQTSTYFITSLLESVYKLKKWCYE